MAAVEKRGYFTGWTLKNEGIIAPDERLPWGQTILVGLQHVLAMFGSTVLGPLLMGFDPNTAIFFSGIGTLIFFLIVGGRVPSYLGSSFSFIAVVIRPRLYRHGALNPHIDVALGGIIADRRGLCHHWPYCHLHGLQVDRILDAPSRHRCRCGSYWSESGPGCHCRCQWQPV